MAINFILFYNEQSSDDKDLEPVRRIRRFRDLTNPFDGLSERQIVERYRFTSDIIMEITNLIKSDIQRHTRRNRPLPPMFQVCLMLRYTE